MQDITDGAVGLQRAEERIGSIGGGVTESSMRLEDTSFGRRGEHGGVDPLSRVGLAVGARGGR